MTNMPIRTRKALGWLLPAILALVLAVPAFAADTSDSTYQATVPVSDTSTAQRGKAFAEALDHVLARVAGHALASTPGADEAGTYVQQYQYHRAPAGADKPFVLSVGFAPDSVRHLARELGAPAPDVADAGGSDADADNDVAGDEQPFAGRQAGNRVLWISGIRSGRDFADAVHALDGLAGVQDVDVLGAENDGMQVRVHTTLSLGGLVGALGDSGRFTDAGQPQAGAAASLHWQK